MTTTAQQFPIPSHARVLPGSANPAPAPWPATAATDTTAIDAAAVARRIVSSLNDALARADYAAVADLFLPDGDGDGSTDDDARPAGFWRDHLVLSWRFRTLKGRERIRAFLRECCGSPGGRGAVRLEVDESTEFRRPQVAGFRPRGDVTGVGFFVRVENAVGVGRGIVRVVEVDGGEWKVWTLFTTLEELQGFEERRGPRREMGVQHGEVAGRKNWAERRREEQEFLGDGKGPEVLIIGAGQGGLTAAARLKLLSVPALAIDVNKAVGDNWRKRYHQLVLHDPVWYDHMPYIPFPDTWPVFTPKDKLADWFESYVKALDLNVWTQSKMVSSSWDESKKEWTAVIERVRTDNGQIQTRTLHPKHIILATGHSGKTNMPCIPGMDSFQGDVICHSADFPGASESGKGRNAVVVGACNSSIDICQDYVEKGYDVTLVQRSSTCVMSSEGILKVTLGDLYEEGSPPVEDSDIWSYGWPAEVLKARHVDLAKTVGERDKEILEGLERAGFKTDRGPHDAGLLMKYLQRGGGYYIDVGGTKLIIEGKIKVKQGQEVVQVLPRGLRFSDGTELEADEIVFATGYDNMRTAARAILGDALADKVGDVWGLDEEGEMRTIWRESGHPGLWFHGGNLAFCRYFSRLLALQIKSRLEGLHR
ncbi:hypothetical protein VTK56DRAFT_6473 [Thermocarpiscus australiensis]